MSEDRTIRRASSQEQKFTLPFVYADYASDFIATYSQRGNIVLTKRSEDLENGSVEINGNELVIRLTQEDTKSLGVGDLLFQLKLFTLNKQAIYSDELIFFIKDVLNDEVLK